MSGMPHLQAGDRLHRTRTNDGPNGTAQAETSSATVEPAAAARAGGVRSSMPPGTYLDRTCRSARRRHCVESRSTG
jgi:hypothetical protein